MKPELAQKLSDLMTGQRVGTLGVLIEGAPYAGLVPFAVYPGFQSLIIHASDLARHSVGLFEGASFSFLVHEPDDPAGNPLQVVRASFQGRVEKMVRNTPAYETARQVYLNKFPESAPIFGMGDFHLYDLQISKGRFVAGFGQIINLSQDNLANLESKI